VTGVQTCALPIWASLKLAALDDGQVASDLTVFPQHVAAMM
jgi:hypothetical protein